jgi:hypothetical protein
MVRVAVKAVRWCLRGIGVLYALQIIVIVFWHFVPMKRQEFQGARYEIHRGIELPFGLIPLIGVSAAFIDEPVYLVITHPDSRREAEHHDVPYDIYEKYPKVWPRSKR